MKPGTNCSTRGRSRRRPRSPRSQNLAPLSPRRCAPGSHAAPAAKAFRDLQGDARASHLLHNRDCSVGNTQMEDRVGRKPTAPLKFPTNLKAKSAGQRSEALLSNTVPAQIAYYHVEEKWKHKAVAWELACALAYAHLHPQEYPLQGAKVKSGSEKPRPSTPFERPVNVPLMWQPPNVMAMPETPEIVNPTQAAQLLTNRSLPLAIC